MYAYIENPIAISVSDIPNNHIKVIPSDSLCKIEKINDHLYVVTPAKTGGLDLIVMNIEDDKEELIGRYHFRIRLVPSPEIKLSWQKEGKINKNIIIAMPYVLAEIPASFDYEVRFKVIKFTLTFKNGIDQSFISESNRITDEQLDMIKGMDYGQSFILSDVIIQGPEGQRTLNIESTFTIY